MKSRVFMLILLVTIMGTECKRGSQQETILTVHYLMGNVWNITAHGEKAVIPGDVIMQNDTIITAASAMVDINFGDKGVIRIFENSNVKIVMLDRDADSEGLRFDINDGKMFVILSKLSKGSSFTTNTPTISAAVRGTSYSIKVDKSYSSVAVYKGSVFVSPIKHGEVMKKFEKTVDVNKKTVMDNNLVAEVLAGKKQIEAVSLKPDELGSMKNEIKDLRVSEKLKEEVRVEYKELLGGNNVDPRLQQTGTPIMGKEQTKIRQDDVKTDKKNNEIQDKDKKAKGVQTLPNL